MKSLAFSFAVLPLGGCAIAAGVIFASLIKSESYSPELTNSLFTKAMMGFALVESFMFIVLGIVALIYVF